MKKILSIILCLTMLLSISSVVFAADTETVGGKITLTQFMGANIEDTKTVTINVKGQNAVIDKAEFFAVADSMVLTSSLKPSATDQNGIFITLETNDGEYLYCYVSQSGGVDKYSLAMSRLPYALYTLDDGSKINKIISLSAAQTKKVSQWAKDIVEKFENTYGLSESDFGTYDYTQNITREIFCNMADYTLRQNGYDTGHYDLNPFEDVSSPTVSRLYALGIINGKSETVFAPSDYITREEAAVIVYRMAEFMKKNIPKTDDTPYYNDENQISDWAVNAVKVMRKMGIMQGVGENEFSPKSTYTIEQSITVMARLYEYNDQ